MKIVVDRATVNKAVIEYVLKNLIGNGSQYEAKESKVALSKAGVCEITLQTKELELYEEDTHE